MKWEMTKQFKVALMSGKLNLKKASPKFWTATSIRKNGRKVETQKIVFDINKPSSNPKEEEPEWLKYLAKRESFQTKYKAKMTSFKNPKYDISHFLIRYKDMIIARLILDEKLDSHIISSDTITIMWNDPFMVVE